MSRLSYSSLRFIFHELFLKTVWWYFLNAAGIRCDLVFSEGDFLGKMHSKLKMGTYFSDGFLFACTHFILAVDKYKRCEMEKH